VGNNIVVDASGMGRLIGTDASVPVAASYPSHPITQRFTLLTAYPLARSATPVSGGVNGRIAQAFVESGERERHAVRGDEQVGALEGRGRGRDERELHGPLGEPRLDASRGCLVRGSDPRLHHAHARAGAAVRVERWSGGGVERWSGGGVERWGGRGRRRRGVRVRAVLLRDRTAELREVLVRRLLVVLAGRALLDGDCAHRAFAEAGAEAVAVGLADQLRLAVHDGDRAFGARRGADSAAVALALVDPDDGANILSHGVLLSSEDQANAARKPAP
jgi:hypothetical protein